jgi:hypothetical protein
MTGGIAVIETIRRVDDTEGKPFCVTVTTYPADRNQFVLTVGKVLDLGTDTVGPDGPRR